MFINICSRRLFLLRDILNFQKKTMRSLFQKVSYFLQRYPLYKSGRTNAHVSLLQYQVLISYDCLEVFVPDNIQLIMITERKRENNFFIFRVCTERTKISGLKELIMVLDVPFIKPLII